MQRRHFITSALVGAPAFLYGGRTRKYNVAVVGAGNQGTRRVMEAMASGECRVAALCDLDPSQLASAAKKVAGMSGDQPTTYQDFREMLRDARPEITIVATPDHWHASVALASIRSGSHVFIEPPMCHTLLEGQEVVRAARESDRSVQCGADWNLLPPARIGEVQLVRAYIDSPSAPGKVVRDSDPPEGMDWRIWCGPAPYRPFNRSIHPGGFRRYLDYSKGPMSGLLYHALAWTDEQQPIHVHSISGRYLRRHGGDAPDTQTACFEFQSFTVELEHRTYLGGVSDHVQTGVWFHGTKGTVHRGLPSGSEQFSGFLNNIRNRRKNLEQLAGCERAVRLSSWDSKCTFPLC